MRNKVLYISILVILGFFTASSTLAADGSGTATVSPATSTVGSAGGTHTFTFTAAETMDSGGISITVPSDWSAPQGSSGTAGYTTANSTAGIIADVFDTLDSAINWTATYHMALSSDTSDKQEGTASLSNTINAGAAANEQWYFDYGSANNWGGVNSNNLRVGMWLKSNVNTASGDFSWQNDDTASLASPLDTISMPALTANAWTYTSATLGATSRTSISSYGFRYTNDIGAVTLKADSLSVLFDNLDATTNWGGSTANVTISALNTSGNYQEGTAAIRCSFAAGAVVGNKCLRTAGGASNFTMGPGTKVSFWVRSSVALSAGDFQWMDDGTASLGSPEDTINLPAISANTWTYVTLTAGNSANKTLRSYGFNQAVDKGAFTLDIDALGKEIDAADSTAGWTAPTATVQTLSSDASVFHEGTASLKNIITASAAAGDKWYATSSSAQNWSSYTTVGFWIRSTVNTSAGDLQFEYDDVGDLSSPIATLNIGALSANTWSFQKLTLSGTRTSVNSYGVKYATDIGAATINLDDILLGPGSIAFPGGGDINARILSLASSQTIDIVYGSGGGTSGATAPSTATTSVFTTKSKISDSGTLTAIVSSPTIEVTQLPVAFAILPVSNSVAGTPATVTIEARNADDSVNTSYNSGVTLNVTGSATGGGLVTITSGVGTTTVNDTVAETVTLSLTDSQGTGLNASSTQTVTFASGPAASFALNNPGSVYVQNRAALSVTQYDQYNNLVNNATTTVYLYSDSSSANSIFYDAATDGNIITLITIPSGASSANFWYYDDVAGTYTITASDNSSTPDGAVGIIDATTSVTFLPVAVKFVILPIAASTTVGTNIDVTIQAQKSDNSVDTNWQDDVTLVLSGSGSGGGLVNIVNGVGSATISDTVAETVTLSLSDTQSTNLDVSSTQIIIFFAGSPSQLLLNHPGSITAGNRASYTVTRKDNYGNITTNSITTIYLYSSSSGGAKAFYPDAVSSSTITFVTIGDGFSTAQFYYYDELAGTFTITASDNASTPDGVTGIADATDSLVVNVGAVAQFSLDNPDATMSAGTRVGYNVSRSDAFDNTVTSGSNTVYLYSNSTASTSAFYDAGINGNIITFIDITDGQSSAAFWYYDDGAGTWTLTASDNGSSPDAEAGIIDATTSVTVSMAPIIPTRFVIYAATTSAVGGTVSVTVKAEDGSGNVDTTYQQGVTLNTTGSATAGGFVNVVNGVGSVNITDTVAESVILSLTDSQGTGLDVSDTETIVFTPGAITQFALTHPDTMTAGDRAAYQVSRLDNYNNYVTSGVTPVYLYSDSASTNKAFYDASSGGNLITQISIIDGATSTSFWYYDDAAAFITVTASDNSSAADGSAGIADATDALTILAGPVAQFTITHPGDMTAGTRLGYSVSRADEFGNSVDAGSTQIYLYTSSLATSTKFYNLASGGGEITSVIIAASSTSADFWYYNETAGTHSVTVSDNASAPDGATGIADDADSLQVLSVAITATRFALSSDLNSAIVGNPITITIRAVDNSDNVDTSFNSSVTLQVSGSATGEGVVNFTNGTAEVVINDSVGEIVLVSLSDTAATGLNSSETLNLIFTGVPANTGGAIVLPTAATVGFSGSGFPEGRVTIVTVGEGLIPVSQRVIPTSGNFSINFSDVLPGFVYYGLVATDKDNRPSQTKLYKIDVNEPTLIQRQISLPPTLGIRRQQVTRGDFATLEGYSSPNSLVEASIDNAIITERVRADQDGYYKILYNTALLAIDFHSARVRKISADGTIGDYSLSVSFRVSDVFISRTDINGDGAIDVRDLSIFIGHWFSQDASSRMELDFNQDGKVDIQDLSIFAQSLGSAK